MGRAMCIDLDTEKREGERLVLYIRGKCAFCLNFSPTYGQLVSGLYIYATTLPARHLIDKKYMFEECKPNQHRLLYIVANPSHDVVMWVRMYDCIHSGSITLQILEFRGSANY